MKTETGKSQTFHVSPWRLFLPWLIFGPLIAFFLIVASTVPLTKQGEKEALWLTAGLFGVIAVLVYLPIWRTRLILTTEGIRLHQAGYTLETAWTNLGGLISDRGAEGFVTREAMTGKGPKRLAAASQIGRGLVGFYDEERLALLAAHRLIPIEAFAMHLRSGQKFRSVLLSAAPHLKADLEAIASQPG